LIQEQLEVLRSTTDLEQRKDAVEQISLDLSENVPNLFTGYTLTDIAVQEEVRNLAGWEFPDGTPGSGVPDATAMWGHVWLAG
jgi:peptide/nickel transport system substrate-binding protein